MDLARIGSSDSSEDEGAKDGIERVRSNLQDILEDATEETTSQATERGHRRDPSQSSRKTSRKSSISSIKVSPLPSIPPIPTQHSSGVNTKKGVAKSAMKVWNALTNRKSPTGPSAKGKHGIHEAIAPFYEEGKLDQPRPVEVALTLENTASKRRRSSASSANRADPIKIVYGTPPKEKQSMTDKNPFPAQESKPSANAQTDDERDPASEASARTDVLSIEVPPPPRLRKRSSRKSIRKGASSHGATVNGRLAATAMSPRSRRSSMYSFDLDVETPRSDSFDLPRSPLLPSANGIVQSGSASPAAGSHAGVLSLSPVAFGALMDGALSFGLENDDPSADRSGDRLTPGGHRRHKSVSSARNRSRPVSVASDKTGPSPRVSKRFSKRASILPPPALDLLKESPSEPVPKIPEQYKSPTTCAGQSNNGGSTINSALRAPSPEPYAQRLHPYAVRGLREYEDCLDEWELFVHRVKEEEGVDGREVSEAGPGF